MKHRNRIFCASFRFVLGMVAVICFIPLLASAQERYSGPEQLLFQLANRARVAQGLKPLRWDDALANAARDHASRMAQQNTLSHQLPGELGLKERVVRTGARFSAIAENVAEGPNAERIHQEWMMSPPHRENLLDPQLDSVGIAVAQRNGILFASEDFSQTVPVLTLMDQEKLLAAHLESLGLRVLNYIDDARQTCAMDNGYAGNHRPSFVLHYATTDPSDVPDMLRQRVQTGRYHSVAVGACASDGRTGFASYRLAVMLFE